jgi:hypothetical protein
VGCALSGQEVAARRLWGRWSTLGAATKREGKSMTFQAGNRVVAESESTLRPARCGIVREVVHEDPRARYRIEWDDGRTSVYTPAAGALRLAPEAAKRAG